MRGTQAQSTGDLRYERSPPTDEDKHVADQESALETGGCETRDSGIGNRDIEHVVIEDDIAETPTSSTLSTATHPKSWKRSLCEDHARDLVCTRCSHRSRCPESLDRHYRCLRTDDKHFKCNQCGKRFARPDNRATYQHACKH